MNDTLMLKIFIDSYREVVVIKIENNKAIAVIDVVGDSRKREEYIETLSLNVVDLVKRELKEVRRCGNSYSYSLYEEAMCLKTQDMCTPISYIAYISCNEEICNEEKLVNTIKCIAFRY